MGEIEWLHPELPEAGSASWVAVDVAGARGLVVGPDDVLVIVFPARATPAVLQEHQHRCREALGDRFLLVAGDDVRLAKVQPGSWGQTAIEDGWRGR